MNPLVSVVIPTYNRAEMLHRAVESVCSQDYKNLEIIIIDDGSTDNTTDIVKGFQDNRITLYRLNKNQGVSIARNEGIRKSRGDYIAFLDSDDEFLPRKLARCLDVFSSVKPVPGMVFSNSRIVGKNTSKGRDVDKSGFVDLSRFPASVFLPPMTWVLDRSVIEKAGYFDENIKSSEDMDFFARIVRSVPVYFLDECLVDVHVHSSFIGRDIDNIADNIRLYLLDKWLPEMKKDPRFLSDFYYCAGKHHVRLKEFSMSIPWLWKALLVEPRNTRCYGKLFRAMIGVIFEAVGIRQDKTHIREYYDRGIRHSKKF